MARRKPRRGEYICTCGAYRFPHRFGSGRCSGYFIAVEQWESHYGSGDCDLCGEWSGRLVGGVCAPCRDRHKLP